MTDHHGASGPQLPDFSARGGAAGGGPGDASGGAARGSPHGSAGSNGSGGRSHRPLTVFLLGGAGCVVLVLAILALVLSQTVFRAPPEDPLAVEETGTATEDPERTRPSEYIPPEEHTDEAAGGEVTFAEQPTVECTLLENEVVTEQLAGVVRGGGLEFTPAADWEVGANWGVSTAYTVDESFAHQAVEAGWFTVAGVGAIEVPDEEGGYPGAEETARAIFQCGLSRDDVQEIYGHPAELEGYRDEPTTVDGYPAWAVSADVRLEESAPFRTTDTWHQVVIVVDTPMGPAVFDGGAALGHAQQVADLESMIESLRVM